jgi:hypothetical protein
MCTLDSFTMGEASNLEIERSAAAKLLETYSGTMISGAKTGSHVQPSASSAPPTSDPLSARIVADRLTSFDTLALSPSPLPPPQLEELAVEKACLLGVRIEKCTSAADKKLMYEQACEVLTYMHSEMERSQLDNITRESTDAGALNPPRMRTLSPHSWWLILFLAISRYITHLIRCSALISFP